MAALLLVAHGSRREASNDEVRVLTESLRQSADGQFEFIDCAFLELADPLIPEGVNRCVAARATQVVVLPYFLSAGRHVSKDIPEIIDVARRQHPGVNIHIAPYLGLSADIIPALIKMANK